MSSAQSWSVKGIDPKVREAAREAAARQGMSLGEYLNQALANQQPQTNGAPNTPATTHAPPRARTRFSQPGAHADLDEDDDWSISGPSTLPRNTDPVRLAQRLESIERRTQLAVSGLDRAVSTIDRSVLGLAARIEDAEALSGESADRIADALDQFRIAGETLSGRLEQAEAEVSESRRVLDGATGQLSDAKSELTSAKERLEGQVAIAEEVARRAEAAASFLTTELENRDAAIGHKLGAIEDQTRENVTQALADARAAAEEAARQAAEASADAVTELRRLQERMAERLTETENSARRAVDSPWVGRARSGGADEAVDVVDHRCGALGACSVEVTVLVVGVGVARVCVVGVAVGADAVTRSPAVQGVCGVDGSPADGHAVAWIVDADVGLAAALGRGGA